MMREVNDKVLEGQSQKIRCNAAQLGTGAKRLADVRRKFSDAQVCPLSPHFHRYEEFSLMQLIARRFRL